MGVPLVTIGLPVYNGELYVRETLESILAQSFEDFLLVISDNGSTDSTPEIVAELARRDSRIEFRRSPENRGAAWNYNTVAENVQSPFFKWIAHDDLHDPEYLAACLAVATSEPDVVAVHCRSRYIDDAGREISRSFRREGFGDESPSSRLHDVLHSHHDHTFAFSLMRTSTLREIRPFVPGFAADGIMLAEFALRGRMMQLPGHLFANRLHTRRSVAEHSGRSGKLSYQSWWGGPTLRPDRTPTWAASARFWSAVDLSPVSGRERRRCFGEVAAWAGARWKALVVESPHAARSKIPALSR
jgi:glycosyltransferase involved in cell wall biosynthesis